MEKYLSILKDIDYTLQRYAESIEIIEKDYPHEELRSIDFNTRKTRISKEYNQLKSSLQQLFIKLDDEIKRLRVEQPYFDKALYLQKREIFPKYCIFGRLKVIHEMLQDNVYIPRVIQFPLQKALYSYDEEKSLIFIYQYLLRVLQISPLNKLDFLLIDTKSLGHSLNFIRPILNNKFIYKQRILTYADEIEEALKELSDYMENLLQKQLSGFSNWQDYNDKNKNNQLPLKVLVINGFPEQFSINALLYISRLVKFGAMTGINIFILIDNIEKNNNRLEKVKDIILDNSYNIENMKYFLEDELKELRFQNTLEALPQPKDIKRFLEQINKAYLKDSTIKGEIDNFWEEDKFWKQSSTEGISIPIGWDINENIINFEIGFEYSEHHTLIGGRSGSGKSNLVNVIIQNLAFFYSPDEIELFLLDYKEGVEFNSYTNPILTHASLIAINSNVSYGLSFLEYILKEKDRRSELFKESQTKDFKEYRIKTDKNLTRIIIIIDEFQTLFTTKERIRIEQIFVELLRKGRSFGIHLILSTQTLSGVDVGSISQLKSQIGNRIALAMGEDESNTFLSMSNDAAAKLKGKPEAIYNNRAGNIEGNRKVFIPYASREKMIKLLNKIATKEVNKNIKIYNGEILPELPNQQKFISNNIRLLLGKEQNFKENYFILHFHKEYGSNLLITGKNKSEKQHILNLITLNLRANQSISNIYYINNDFDIKSDLKKSSIEIFQSEIEDKSLIIIDSIDTLTQLYPSPSYGFSRAEDEQESSIYNKFKELLENGYKRDIHFIIFVDNFKRVKTKINEITELFNYRLAFSLNSDLLIDFLELEYNTMIQSIRNNKGIFSNILISQIIEFKFFKKN